MGAGFPIDCAFCKLMPSGVLLHFLLSRLEELRLTLAWLTLPPQLGPCPVGHFIYSVAFCYFKTRGDYIFNKKYARTTALILGGALQLPTAGL